MAFYLFHFLLLFMVSDTGLIISCLVLMFIIIFNIRPTVVYTKNV